MVFVAEAKEAPGRVERAGAGPALGAVTAPVLLALNKIDLVADKRRLLPLIAAYTARVPFREVVPISGRRAAKGWTGWRRRSWACCRRGRRTTRPIRLTDQPETFYVAETVREKISSSPSGGRSPTRPPCGSRSWSSATMAAASISGP